MLHDLSVMLVELFEGCVMSKGFGDISTSLSPTGRGFRGFQHTQYYKNY